jgi:hypothetical protein
MSTLSIRLALLFWAASAGAVALISAWRPWNR